MSDGPFSFVTFMHGLMLSNALKI
jgi:hypothetical protein